MESGTINPGSIPAVQSTTASTPPPGQSSPTGSKEEQSLPYFDKQSLTYPRSVRNIWFDYSSACFHLTLDGAYPYAL